MPPSSLAYNELLFLRYFGCQFLAKPQKKKKKLSRHITSKYCGAARIFGQGRLLHWYQRVPSTAVFGHVTIVFFNIIPQ